MHKALLAAAAITVLGSASAMAQATTTKDNPQTGTTADKMTTTPAPAMKAEPTTTAPATRRKPRLNLCRRMAPASSKCKAATC